MNKVVDDDELFNPHAVMPVRRREFRVRRRKRREKKEVKKEFRCKGQTFPWVFLG